MLTISLFPCQSGLIINMGYEANSRVWKNIYHVLKKMQNEAATCIQALRPPLGGGITSRDVKLSVRVEER